MSSAHEIAAVASCAGLADRSDRVRLEVTGPDRAKFLHNLTTNEVKRLAAGRGCEAFVTSPQGKTIGYVILHVGDDGIWVRTDPGGCVLVLPHFEKYGVFDEVSIDDRSALTSEFHLAGPQAGPLLEEAGGRLPDGPDYAHAVTEVGGFPVRIIRESPLGLGGLTIIGPRATAASVWESLRVRGDKIGAVVIGPETFEILRIEAGTPAFGKEVTARNLPQEFGRDDRTINFVKGCYLGQETVARIDALGHVNQILKGLRFEPGAPSVDPGWQLHDGEKNVGVVTSAAFSPVRNAPVALALLRTSHAQAGRRLEARPATGDLEVSAVTTVSDLPLSRES